MRGDDLGLLVGRLLSEADACSPPPAPSAPPAAPLTPPDLPVQNDDIVILSALSANPLMLLIFLGIYCVLHLFFAPQYYKNPLMRDKGPEAALAQRAEPLRLHPGRPRRCRTTTLKSTPVSTPSAW